MARYNLKIKVGQYTGNGVDKTDISDPGIRPKALFVKGGSNVIVCRTESMKGDVTNPVGQASSDAADIIQGFLNAGFQVGTSVRANANGTVYTYLSIYGSDSQQYFKVGRYIGDGTDDRNIVRDEIGFTPNIAFVMGPGSTGKMFATTEMGSNAAGRLDANAFTTNTIQSLISGGFQVGTTTSVNGANTEYQYIAMRNLPGVICSGSYVGNGVNGRQLTSLLGGSNPALDFFLVKRNGASVGIIRTSLQTGDDSLLCSAAASATNLIESLDADGGVTLGDDDAVNKLGDTYVYIGMKAGEFNAPLSRTAV